MAVQTDQNTVGATAMLLLACDDDAWPAILADHPEASTLAFVQYLKDQYCSPPYIHEDMRRAERASRLALSIAAQLPDVPLADAIAAWGRGIWEALNDPAQAIHSFQRALRGYNAAGDNIMQGRLLANLVFVYTDCGQFAAATQAYNQARDLLHASSEQASFYVLRLEQNYGWLLHNQGHYEQALVVHERALTLAQHHQDAIVQTELQVNRTVTLSMLGRLPEGLALLEAERRAAEQHGQHLTVARIDMSLGELYALVGQPSTGLRSFQSARAGFAQQDNAMERGSVLLGEAVLLERIGALGDACERYSQALDVFRAKEMEPQIGSVLAQGAAAWRRYGLYNRAQQWLDEAHTLWQTQQQPLWQAVVTLEQAALAQATGNNAQALALLDALLLDNKYASLWAQRDLQQGSVLVTEWHQHGDPAVRDQAYAALDRARAYGQTFLNQAIERNATMLLGELLLDNDVDEAERMLDAAAALDDALRHELSVEELKAACHTQAEDLLARRLRLALTRNDTTQALSYAWHAKGSALLDVLYAAEDTYQVRGMNVTLEHVRQQLAARRWQIARELSEDGPQAHLESSDPEVQALERHLRDLRHQRNQKHTHRRPASFDVQAALAQMDADLLIEYVPYDDDLLALCANPAGQCRVVPLGPMRSLHRPFRRLHFALANVIQNGQDPARLRQYEVQWRTECQARLKECYELLIAPLGPIPHDARVLIAPCAPLTLVPFAALWDGTTYVVERHALQMIPSGALLAAPPTATTATGMRILGSSVDHALAAVATEIQAIQAIVPGAVASLDDPHGIQTLLTMTPPRVLHLATHFVPRDDAPLFAALQLADGLLSVEQCYDLPLRGTELVTLSACATGSGLDSGGTLLALQSALFLAGARHVVSSLWPIGDQTTITWMKQFYQHLTAGRAPADAVRATQLAYIAQPYENHPAFWAVFTCSRR